MVVIKLRWKKWDNSKDQGRCWYCGSPTNYVLYGPKDDYFEVFCCRRCKGRHGRIIRRKSLKISAKTKGKENEKSIADRGLTGKQA